MSCTNRAGHQATWDRQSLSYLTAFIMVRSSNSTSSGTTTTRVQWTLLRKFAGRKTTAQQAWVLGIFVETRDDAVCCGPTNYFVRRVALVFYWVGLVYTLARWRYQVRSNSEYILQLRVTTGSIGLSAIDPVCVYIHRTSYIFRNTSIYLAGRSTHSSIG